MSARHPAASDEEIRAALRETRVVAMVGASPDPARPSHGVMRFLQRHGYRVVPVNPRATEAINGEPVRARLADVPGPIDMVDIFRRADRAGEAVDEAIALKDAKGIRFVWMQLGVIDRAAASRAGQAGLTVVMDRCPAIEYPRLMAG